MTFPAEPRKRLAREDVRYLAFEGGGGKGFAFLGALKALEEESILRHVEWPAEPGFSRAEFAKWKMPQQVPARRQIVVGQSIRGVSGASAGAITALLVACGYSSDDILAIMQSFNFDMLFEGPDPRYVPRIQVNRDARDYMGAVRILEPPKEYPLFRKALRDTLGSMFPPFTDANLSRGLGNAPIVIRDTLRATGVAVPTAVNVLLSNFSQFMSYLPEDMGFFPGYVARKFFAELIAFKMPKRNGRLQMNVSFWDHFHYFRVKLAVTGTNVESGKSGIFSVDTSPNFPVADAVRISMSLPIAYKPVTIRREHYPPDYLDEWANGVWVDGGYLNNLPLRAFDQHGGIGKTLGLRLEVEEAPETINSLWGFLKVYPLKFGFLGAGEAHIGPGTATDTETIILDTEGLDLLVFSPPQSVVESVTASSRKSVLDYFSGTPPARE